MLVKQRARKAEIIRKKQIEKLRIEAQLKKQREDEERRQREAEENARILIEKAKREAEKQRLQEEKRKIEEEKKHQEILIQKQTEEKKKKAMEEEMKLQEELIRKHLQDDSELIYDSNHPDDLNINNSVGDNKNLEQKDETYKDSKNDGNLASTDNIFMDNTTSDKINSMSERAGIMGDNNFDFNAGLASANTAGQDNLGSKSKPTFIIVDDANFMRMLLKKILEEGGYEVVGEAENGKQAIELVEKLSPDAITLDITMPEMDGITALKEILRVKPFMKVIMCSAMDQRDMVLQSLKLGAKDFISKPFEQSKVLDIIKRVLNTK